MATVTIELPDNLVEQTKMHQRELESIVESGLRHLNTRSRSNRMDTSEIFEFFARQPSPEEIVKLRPSRKLQRRFDHILAMSKERALTEDEKEEWDEYEFVEH